MWHIDFETFSELDLPKVGSFRYSEDPSTQALILAFSNGKAEPIGVDLSQPGYLAKLSPLFKAIQRGEIICAHNVTFERNIWTNVCKFPITPKEDQWDCTAARARLIALPGSLDNVSKILGVPGKDPRGAALMNIFSKPGKKGVRVFPKDRPEEFQEYIEYCIQDVRAEMAISEILPKMSPVERRAFLLDYKINMRGMPVNLELVRRAHVYVEEYSEASLAKAVEIAGCRPSQREKTLEYLKSRGFELPNLQAATVEELASNPDLPADLVELLNYRIELSRAGTKKLTTILNMASEDGRIRGGFLFAAATTLRWSSVGVQMHNLQKPEGEANPDVVLDLLSMDRANDLPLIFQRPLTVLAQSIRGFFESPTQFLVADYSSVEPRGLAWACDEDWMLKAYRNKEDAYKIAASRVYHTDPKSIDDHQRFMGKQLVLGCGYGMGPPRFIETCRKFGVEISPESSEEAVYGYRASVPKITGFWKDLEAGAILATETWKSVKVGKFTFRPVTLKNGFRLLYLDMPSGAIVYPDPSVGVEEWYGKARKKFMFWTALGSSWIQTDTFGGSLVENVIQAMTRDILRDGMVAADDEGFELCGHCHDEAIAEDGSPEDFKEFERLLCSSSPWAEGFPIATSGYIAKRYKK